MMDEGKERVSFVTRPEEGLVSTPATRRLPMVAGKGVRFQLGPKQSKGYSSVYINRQYCSGWFRDG
jgi:hypothetical protein